MSYDFEVYGNVALTPRDLVRLASGTGTRARRDRGWGAKRVQASDESGGVAFTIDGPVRVEPEDLPPGVARSTLVYSVQVPYVVDTSTGGFRTHVDERHLAAARAYVADLAHRVEGTVVDPQIQKPVIVGSPEDATVTDEALFLHLEWFRRLDGSVESMALAADYLRSARLTLPSAVPVRFGPHEPLQGRLPRDGDNRFDEMYRDECRLSTMAMTGKGFSSGSISPWSSITGSGYQSASVVFDLAAIRGSEVLDRIQDFLVEMARQSGSFFAFAELNTSRYTTARVRGFDGAWGGLPVDPQWLTWYDSAYAPLVRPYLTVGSTQEFEGGLLHRWSEAPTRAEEIRPLLSRDPWIPDELRGTVEDTPGGVRGREPAKVMPAALRGGHG